MNDEKNNKFDFINEKILNQKMPGQSPLRTVLFVIVCAMLFGLISCLTFYWAEPYIEHFLMTGTVKMERAMPRNGIQNRMLRSQPSRWKRR